MLLTCNRSSKICPRPGGRKAITRFCATIAHRGGDFSTKGAIMRTFPDITGKKFGRWTAIKEDRIAVHEVHWICQCECGVTRHIPRARLLSGESRSCGCLRNEHVSAAKTTHGGTRKSGPQKEYGVWRAMIQRCTSEKCSAFKNYGGRGITVCQRWLESFPNFYEDMGMRPNSGMCLERKNNDLGYSKENCIWATRTSQANNTRTNVFVQHNGESHTITEWARFYGLDPFLIFGRMRKGWSFVESISTPIRKNARTHHNAI